jgi:hypothetical protein
MTTHIDMRSTPTMIRTDASNTFANHTLRVRVPGILRDVITLNPDYPPSIQGALQALHDEITADQPITPLSPPAPDYDGWMYAFAKHDGHTWLNTDWFFAETYFYRRIIEAVRWWELGRDPFLPRKVEELANPALWEALGNVLAAPRTLGEGLHHALWGNRIDLSYAQAMAHGWGVAQGDLLVDHAPDIVRAIHDAPAPNVHIVTDNFGSELAMDLALVDHLLYDSHKPTRVVLHVKYHPMFVSDATAPDVLAFLRELATRGGDFGALGQRLRLALEAGQLRLAPDWYWCSSENLGNLPYRLNLTFAGATLAIFKGDFNYRRVVGDVILPAETPFADAVRYADFPAPLAVLRTLKSDPVVGLSAGEAERLNAADSLWRVNGRRGVIQFVHHEA